MNDLRKHLSTCLLGITALLGGVSPAWAPPPPPTQGTAPNLGTAANFAALGGTGVTCTVPNPALPAVTIIGGDVGSGSVATTTVTGFPGFTPGANRCSLSGNVLFNQTAAITDLIKAYNTLDTLPGNSSCPSADATHNFAGSLDGLPPLSPGVYCISGTGTLTGTLTLNGPANGIWIFKAASDLTPKGGTVVMAGGGSACNVYWKVGTAVDLLNTAFVGNVLAGTAITFTGTAPRGTASSLVGRALAQSDVTMTGANIAACTGGKAGGPPSCKGKECDRDDDDKDQDRDKDKDKGKDRDEDKDKGHESDHHHPFGSNDDHDRKSGRKGGDR